MYNEWPSQGGEDVEAVCFHFVLGGRLTLDKTNPQGEDSR